MKTQFFCSILFVLILCACTPAGSQATATNVQISSLRFDPALPGQLKPGDVLHLSGSGNARSEVFSLTESTQVRLSWKQTEGSEFIVSVQSVSDATDRVQFVLQQTPGEGTGDWIFEAGDYIVVISGEGSQWEVSLEIIEFRPSPFTTPENGG